VTFWRKPVAALAVAVLCDGDGAAEVVDYTVASPRLPWNGDKSVAGSLGCLAGGAAVAAPLLRCCLRSDAFAPFAPGASLATGVLLAALVGAATSPARPRSRAATMWPPARSLARLAPVLQGLKDVHKIIMYR
jgi:dolichol kinase